MSPGRIQARGELESVKFITAKCIREALDTARTAAEDAGEDGERFESAILELVIDDDPGDAKAPRAVRMSIDADVREGTRVDALLYAAGANSAHGARRTNADKRSAALALLAAWPNSSDAWIAQQCLVSDRFVAKHRPATPNGSGSAREGRDGKVRKLPKKAKMAARSPEKQAKIARRELERVARGWPKAMPVDGLVTVAREWLGSLEAAGRPTATTGSSVQEASNG